MRQKDQTISIAPDQVLGKAEYGDLQGTPVFYCHGFPGCRLEAALLDEAAKLRGIRVIALDRPGYGLSTFVPHRQLLDWPPLLLEVADKLEIERFSVLGVSGGGPYAYACAKHMGNRLDRIALVCALGPYAAHEAVRAMNGMMRFGVYLTHFLPALGAVLYRCLAAFVFRRDPQAIFKVYLQHAAEADRDALADPDRREIFTRSSAEAFRQGGRGPAHDLRLYTAEWGFSLSEIDRPITLWHGQNDRTVPCAFSTYAAERLPQATLKTFPQDGHFSLPLCHTGEILDSLCPNAGLVEDS